MAAPTIALLPEHGYLPLLVVVLAFVNLWCGSKVGKARKEYDVPYPLVSPLLLFASVQRQ